MPRSRFSGSLVSPKLDVVIDMGNPFLNHTVDAFLKIGTVAATKVVAEESYEIVKRVADLVGNPELFYCFDPMITDFQFSSFSYYGSVSSHNFEKSLKKMCKEGAYWGTVAGVYAGMEYGAERIRGTRDWKNAMIGGALTGALVSAASNNNRDKIVMDAITGGAVATAAEFLNYLT
ncbi:hypothetical protein RND71_030863 [Anisodus tanguticus]|uniref:Uncharacterized protein n=1 Tax=Anisodus tanguticus TaxID=243964 RepID=A0AAE1V8P0_9SOLA|nr:hypothetical protein RND71_030863 [Anisodus tanguticus]